MIIELQTDGKAKILANERIYKGSSNVTDLFVIAHDVNATITVAFILPSGLSTPYYPMSRVGTKENTVLWRMRFLPSVTAEEGMVKSALDAISEDENGIAHKTSSLCEFEVYDSIEPIIPTPTDPNVYDVLIARYGALSTDVDILKNTVVLTDITTNPRTGSGEKTYSNGTKKPIQFHDGSGKRGVFAMDVEDGNLILHTKQLDDVSFELNEDGELVVNVDNEIII